MGIIKVRIEADNKIAKGQDGKLYKVVSDITDLKENDIYFAFTDEEDNNAELQSRDNSAHNLDIFP